MFQTFSMSQMHPSYETIFELKRYLYKVRLKVTSLTKSPDWTEEQLKTVLSKLKNNKSADHHGLTYELFKPVMIGDDLFKSLLILSNEVKSQQNIPDFLKFTDITSFYKNKGDRKCGRKSQQKHQ